VKLIKAAHMTEPITARTTRRALELAHDRAAVLHEQVGAAFERAADICDAFGDESHRDRLLERAAHEHAAARREREVATRSRAGLAMGEGDENDASHPS
jgi:hypothetical protein